MNSSDDTLKKYFDSFPGENKRHDIIDELSKVVDRKNISQRTLSEVLSYERKSLQNLLNRETKKFDLILAIKLITLLDLTPIQLIQLYLPFLSDIEIDELAFVKRAIFILDNFDLKVLRKIGFVNRDDTLRSIEQKLLSLYNINTIFEYDNIFKQPLYSKINRPQSNKVEKFWVSSALMQYEKINNNFHFDRSKLKDQLIRIKPYLQTEEKGFIKVINSLYFNGVTVIFQPSLPNMQVRGATLIVNNKPIIILTDSIKTISTAWFALLHELYHVIVDWEMLHDCKIHLSKLEGQNDLLLTEEKANQFAREFILAPNKLHYIYRFIDSPSMVENYAKENQITKSFIYDLYLFDQAEKGNINKYPLYHRYLTSSKQLLENVILCPWENDTDEKQNKIIRLLYNIESN